MLRKTILIYTILVVISSFEVFATVPENKDNQEYYKYEATYAVAVGEETPSAVVLVAGVEDNVSKRTGLRFTASARESLISDLGSRGEYAPSYVPGIESAVLAWHVKNAGATEIPVSAVNIDTGGHYRVTTNYVDPDKPRDRIHADVSAYYVWPIGWVKQCETPPIKPWWFSQENGRFKFDPEEPYKVLEELVEFRTGYIADLYVFFKEGDDGYVEIEYTPFPEPD